MKSLKSAWLRTIHLKGVSFRHVNYTTKLKKQNKKTRTSLVVQWLRICLAEQGTQV